MKQQKLHDPPLVTISHRTDIQFHPHKPADETCFCNCFQKKTANLFLYCVNNLGDLKLLISSLSSPCPSFRSSLWPLMNIICKSTSLNLIFTFYFVSRHTSQVFVHSKFSISHCLDPTALAN